MSYKYLGVIYITHILHHLVAKRYGRRPEFGSESGKKMLVVRALYGLKSSGAAFREFLEEALYDLGYKYSLAYPEVWLIPDIKEKYGFK